MALLIKKAYGPAQPGAGEVTLYTVPASTKAVIEQILVINNTGTNRDITFSIGADSAATRVIPTMTVAAGAVFLYCKEVDGAMALEAAETLRCIVSSATTLTVVVTVMEVS